MAFELTVAVARFPVLMACRRAIARGEPGPGELYAILSLLWASGMGFGAFIAVQSQDWIAALAACVPPAAMLGGICMRYYATPRLVVAMLMVMAVPSAAACILSGETVLVVSGLLIPIYVVAMSGAAFCLHETVVKSLCAEREQRDRALRDPLTGLNNRTGFAEAFAELPADAPVACFYIDLDGFKRVNDTLGHQAGDNVLILVAERLRLAAPVGAILARPGGDEFLAVLRCSEAADAARLGDLLVAAIAGEPYIVEGQGVFIGASAGAALRVGHDCDALIADADDALYRAKADAAAACVVAGKPQRAARPAQAKAARAYG